ncbi:MAG: DNA polymerase III delta prime subunit [Burkholderiaceae bacterium]|jgi:DNA polymerase-3 subunit delta'|nr:MAG: DNA polymerase III delta prime subunit [Burkholderiaceae bacterium]
MSDSDARADIASAPWLQQQFALLLAQRGHAWLLHGPSGLGQYPLGLALVRAWLCDEPIAEGACGRCASCHAVDVRSHADLCVLMPETLMLELGWPLGEKEQTEIDNKKRKPSREIRIDAMRGAIEFTQRTSARGRGKAVLVVPAERMNATAANALLKTLEEPPGDTRFVLASHAAHALLPTVRSRCLGHAMTWPEPAAALAWLQQQGMDPAQGAAALRAAGGRPHEALARLQSGFDGRAWARWPQALARGDARVMADWTPAQAVDALQKLCHDLLARSVGAAPRFFEPADLPNLSAARVAALTGWAKALAQTARHIDHPLQPGLLQDDLVSQARQALNS